MNFTHHTHSLTFTTPQSLGEHYIDTIVQEFIRCRSLCSRFTVLNQQKLHTRDLSTHLSSEGEVKSDISDYADACGVL